MKDKVKSTKYKSLADALRAEVLEALERGEEIDMKKISQKVRSFFRWQYPREGDHDSFPVMLIGLYRKADSENKFKLSIAFPLLATIHQEWESAGNYGNDLFERYGISRRPDGRFSE